MSTTDISPPSGERLALLCRLSQTFNSSLDLDEVLNRVMDEVIAATRAERGFVMLREDDGKLGFRVARGMDRETVFLPQFQVSRSVVDRVALEGEPMLTADAQTDDQLSSRQSIMALGLRSILCVPLKIKDQLLGVVYVDNRFQAGIFGEQDLELLTAIASSAAIAIENARLYRVAVEKGRLERELQMAYEVQAKLLPSETPRIPGWEFAASWHPARVVAGDFYDFIPLAGGQVGLVNADVSDKGMHSALFMALSRSIVRASVDGATSPVDGITRANRLICADASGGMFVTLFYAELDPATGNVTYVNAGHNPPLLCRPQDWAEPGQPLKLANTGVALGVLPGIPFEQRTVHLDPGDFLVLYTDGVVDAQDPQGRFFGMERLERVILDHRHASAADMMAELEKAIADLTGATAQFDDITIVIAKRL